MLTDVETMALEAFADTIVPGRKRSVDDDAIAGESSTPGAVENGALAVLQHPATGIDDGVGGMAHLLNDAASSYARERNITVAEHRQFVDLPYPHRRTLVSELTSERTSTRDLWFLLALFSYMAFDSAPHRHTHEVIRDGSSGLVAMGFAEPDRTGRWRFDPPGYGRELARRKAGTDDKGNLP